MTVKAKDLFRHAGKQALGSLRSLTHQQGSLPSFIIIGAQKGGTTSLYHYLTQHPSVAEALWKETHFFDLNYGRGVGWYRTHFPKISGVNGSPEKVTITGEASPYYLFHLHVPARVHTLLPDVRLIVLLRNPVERAYSHYHHEVSRGYETLSFEAAVAQEPQRLAGEEARMRRDPQYLSLPHQRYSYLARGLYLEQLERWLRYFPRERFLILQSEVFYRDSEASLRSVCEFLDLPPLKLRHYEKTYAGNYPKMNPDTREHLKAFFKPYNERLYEVLNTTFDWNDY